MRRFLSRFFPLFLFLAASAGAHPFLQDSMWVLFEPDRLRVAVNVSLREILVAEQIAATEDSGFDSAAIGAAAEKHRDYVVRHLQISIGDRVLTGTVAALTQPPSLTTAEKTFFQYEIDYPLSGPLPASMTFRHDMLREFPYAPGQAWDISYVVRLRRADSNEISTGLLRYQQPENFPTGWEAPATAASPVVKLDHWRTFRDYLRHGVMHILTGYDHLLFVSALVLATLSFWEMVKVIFAFTLAHTITLALSVFDIFRLPSWVVEPFIAASIIFVAAENLLFPQRAHSRVRLVVAFGFGLIHGLGFAGGLLDAMEGLPAVGIWIALAGFSLGVEIGHQLVVLPLFGLLALGRRQLREGFQLPALRCGSALISLCGAYYLFVSVRTQFFVR